MSLRLLTALAGITFFTCFGLPAWGADEDSGADETPPAAAAPAENTATEEKPAEEAETPAKEETEQPDAASAPKGDATNQDAANQAEAPENLEQAQEKFDTVVSEWKQGLKELALLQESYRKADEAKQKEMAAEFNNKRKQLADEVKPQLILAAKQLYKLQGKENEDLQNFLRMVLLEKFQEDRWDELYELTHLLKNSGLEEPQLDLFDAIASFGTNRFEEAEENIDKAAEAGLLQMPVSQGQEPELVTRRRDLGMQIRAAAPEYQKYWEEEKAKRAAEAKADDLPRVKLQTSKGDIVLELFENEAPNTVANFVSLVEKGFYDGVIFHRVLPGFMAQGGDPQGTGGGGPGYRIPCECYKDDIRRHFTGSLSMAKTAQRDTGGSQFFLTFRPTPHLNGAHTVFGRVIEGLDVLSDLQRIDPSDRSSQIVPDKIEKATVLRKRDHEYIPKTMPEI